jgi:hypothetical protein
LKNFDVALSWIPEYRPRILCPRIPFPARGRSLKGSCPDPAMSSVPGRPIGTVACARYVSPGFIDRTVIRIVFFQERRCGEGRTYSCMRATSIACDTEK